MAKPTHFFISHSNKIRAGWIANVLHSAGYRVGVDANFDPAKRIHDEIDEKIRNCEVFVVLLSHSWLASEWTRGELALAVSYRKKILVFAIENIAPQPPLDPYPFHHAFSCNFETADLIIAKSREALAGTKLARAKPTAAFALCTPAVRQSAHHAYPVTIFSRFSAYRDMTTSLARHARYLLLWTMNGSPLKATPSAGMLTKEDEEFAKLPTPSRGKWRLVIFRNDAEIVEYTTRRQAGDSRIVQFEKSHDPAEGAYLYFTSVERLAAPPGQASGENALQDLDITVMMVSPENGLLVSSAFSTNALERTSRVLHTTIVPIERAISDSDEFQQERYRSLYAGIESKRRMFQDLVEDPDCLTTRTTFVRPESIETLLERERVV